MILVSDDDSVDCRVKAGLRAFDATLGCIGTTTQVSETLLDSFQFDRGHVPHLTPVPREEEERSTSLVMENGQLKDVLFVDRLKTKTTINLLSEKSLLSAAAAQLSLLSAVVP
ncbi:hypothetical protein WN943_026923 [Citrus x changshan-huyou]